MSDDGAILTVRDLRTYFYTADGVVKAVDGVSFAVGYRQTFALVGESGCGKSVTALSIMRLVPDPPGKILCPTPKQTAQARKAGRQLPPPSRIVLDGRSLLELSERQMREVRGGKVAMIFQEPMTSLNPVYTIGGQILEAVKLHQRLPGRRARDLAVDMLAQVGIPDPAQRYREYPHQLSGGMRQRTMIAMALSCNPRLLIADEPTTALDVTIQAQILDLLKRLQDERGLSILLITHDLAVVAETADAVAVMYASKLVELADVRTLFARPLHPYTHGLFRSLPRLGQRTDRLETIPGNVPNPLAFPSGCKFHPRCPVGRKLDRCRSDEPALRAVEPNHYVACWECRGYADAPAGDQAGGPIPNRPDADEPAK